MTSVSTKGAVEKQIGPIAWIYDWATTGDGVCRRDTSAIPSAKTRNFFVIADLLIFC